MTFNAKDFLQHVTEAPGIYQMLDISDNVIYVGKAKNLKKRLSSYFRTQVDSVKTSALVKKIHAIRVIATTNENEALLLETQLIKHYRPRYNILFKDDKSFPYLHLTDHPYPRLMLRRSQQKPQGDYFGPYANTMGVREALNILQKCFLIRPCSDSFFNHRSRPCLQYAIKRCSAPCVNHISQAAYQTEVEHAKAFLQGKGQDLIQTLSERMTQAATAKHYEQAAFYRDQIKGLHQLDKDQHGHGGHCDIFAIAMANTQLAIQVLHIRAGKVIGTATYFPANPQQQTGAEVLESFISQFYFSQIGREIPLKIIVNQPLPEQQWLARALSHQAQTKISIVNNVKQPYLTWLNLCIDNAQLTLKSHMVSSHMLDQRYQALADLLTLPPKANWHLECFDISHSLGEATKASCVVFNERGPCKAAYRLFNIEGITPGDDYAAMAQALRRRYQALKEQNRPLPDILLIDGGRGQLNQAKAVLQELQLDTMIIIGIAKGFGRKPGLETLWINDDQTAVQLPAHAPALHLLQHLRDEAHRFAISKHRVQRRKNRRSSNLEDIDGIGIKKRQQLLNFFGGLNELKAASCKALQKVPGIGPKLALKIFNALQKK